MNNFTDILKMAIGGTNETFEKRELSKKGMITDGLQAALEKTPDYDMKNIFGNEETQDVKSSNISDSLQEIENMKHLLDILERNIKGELTSQDVEELKGNIQKWTTDMMRLSEMIDNLDSIAVSDIILKKETQDKEKSDGLEESDDSEVYHIDKEEIANFVENMAEYINNFKDEIKHYESDEELYEYWNEAECDASDYGSDEYVYSTKAKAKVACKEEIVKALEDMKLYCEDEKDNIVSYTSDYFSDLESKLNDFVDEFFETYDDYMSLECSEEGQKYVYEKKLELFDQQDFKDKINEISLDDTLEKVKKAIFDAIEDDLFDMKKYFDMCEYDQDEDYYCFEMDDACNAINKNIDEFFKVAVESFPTQVSVEYTKKVLDFIEHIEDKLKRL